MKTGLSPPKTGAPTPPQKNHFLLVLWSEPHRVKWSPKGFHLKVLNKGTPNTHSRPILEYEKVFSVLQWWMKWSEVYLQRVFPEEAKGMSKHVYGPDLLTVHRLQFRLHSEVLQQTQSQLLKKTKRRTRKSAEPVKACYFQPQFYFSAVGSDIKISHSCTCQCTIMSFNTGYEMSLFSHLFLTLVLWILILNLSK